MVGTDPDSRFFEQRYAEAGDDLAVLPWAELRPRAALVEWLDRQPRPPAGPALVVACGLGDDAEELARRGWVVRAFDVAPTAIRQCRQRFPDSAVDYRVADLFALPPEWSAGHDLVVEIQTIQSLPLDRRDATVAAIAAMVAPGGRIFVRASGRADDEVVHTRPWPLSRAELAGFTRHGLREESFVEQSDANGRAWFHASYARPPGP